MPLPDLAGDAAQAGLQVVAQPTSGVGAPRPSPENSDIINALSTFHPALNRFMDQKVQDNAAEQMALGAKARLTQDGTAAAVMTPEQDPYWQQGYMKQHGLMAGQAAASDMQLQYEESKNQPGFNPDTFFSKFAKQDSQGLNDKDALAGYLPHVTNMEGQLRADFAKTQLKEVRDTQATTTATQVRQMVQSSIDSHDTPEVQAQKFEQLVQEQKDAGNATRPEVTEQLIREMSAKSNLLPPESFDFLFKEGVGGRSIADSNGPNGPLRGAIEQARAQAQVAQAKRVGDAAKKVSMTNLVTLGKAIETDPLSLGDPWALVSQHLGPGEMFETGAAAEAAAKNIFEKQQKVIDVQTKLQALFNKGPLAAAASIDDPDVKKALQKQVYDPVWAHSNPNDPASVSNTMSTLLTMYSKYHVLDTGIESMLKHSGDFMQEVDTAVGKGPDGKVVPGPSPEFKRTYEMVKAVKAGDNPSLIAMMPKEARTMFATYAAKLEAGASELDAFRTAKLVNSDEGRARVDSQWIPAQKVADVAALTSEFTKWTSHIGAGQATEMARKSLANAQDKVAMSPNLDRAGALKQAVEELKATHVYDGIASYVPVSPGVPQEHFGEAIGAYVEEARMEYKKLHGVDMGDNYYVQPSGDNSTYRILDGLHSEVMPPKPVNDLLRDYLVKHGRDIGSIAGEQAHNADLRSGAATPSLTDAAGLGLGAAGFPDPNRISQRDQADIDFKRGQTRFREGQIHGLTPGDSLLDGKTPLNLGAQIPEPGGLNMNSKDYALDALKNGNPDFALTAFGEGLRLSTYKDDAGKRTIGLGYNIDARSPEQVQQDFSRAGITGDRVQKVLDGKESITPKESMRLYEIVKPQYVAIAKSKFGPEWDSFPSNVKAVLTDMAYNGGNKLFGPILDDMKAGNFAEAAKKVTVSYHDTNGKLVLNNRRIALWRGMLAGQSTFEQMLNQGA